MLVKFGASTDRARRSVLAGGGALAASCALGTRVSAASDAAILRRSIPHGKDMLPVIGIGTSQVFDVGADESKRKTLAAVVAALLDGGGTLIDTASSYDTSEEVVGAIASAPAARGKTFLATKLEERGGKAAEAEFATSLRRLQVKSVDLLQMHNVTEGDPDLGFFRHLKAQGLARYIGATTTDSDDYGAMEALIRRDKPDFIEIDCSIANRAAEARIIPAAADVGAAVLIALPFGRSSLFRKVRGKPLPDIAKEIDARTWSQVFLKYLLGNSAITAVIPGTDKVDHMIDNLAAGRGPLPDAAQRKALVSHFERLG